MMFIRTLCLVVAISGIAGRSLPLQLPRQNGPESVLSVKVNSYSIENADMEQALRALRQTNFAEILVGFEEVAHTKGQKERTFSLSLEHTTAGGVIMALCKEDPNYTFDVVAQRLIHVYPRNHDSDPAGLLDIHIRDFSVEGTMVPAAMIVRLPDLAPELGSYLNAKMSEYYARRGISVGYPGAIGHGNMDPQVHLQIRNATVQQILNRVTLYSQTLYEQSNPDQTGNRIQPTSWIYKFVIDPNAQTGLGGTPHFIAF
jgi:hypothetical protein